MRLAAAPVWGIALATLLSADAARAAGPSASESSPLKAQVVCEHAGVAGRVRCDVEAQIDDGTISWSDAQILDIPKFAIALKGRIGPDDATVKTPTRWRLSFGVVARENGSGSISVRVRAVRCREKVCEALSVIVKADLEVGSS